jgi:hypothetical protein
VTQDIDNDGQCWQYNFIVPIGAFTQEVGTIYWLAVQVMPSGPLSAAGWKTSINHFNDSAVWTLNEQDWVELVYPPWHPYVGQPIDLAFVIDGHRVETQENPVDWGAVQWPFATTTLVGVATEYIYGRVYESGVTDPAGQGAGIAAELGYGPDGSDPDGNPAWTWTAAAYHGDLDNDDEYRATITENTAGRYDYAYRFSYLGSPWLYCDMRDPSHPTPPGGSADGYSADDAGDLVVRDVPPESPCAKWRQAPDCTFGADLPSYGDINIDQQWVSAVYRVADDWLCDGRPITGFGWWGSYVGSEEPMPPPYSPERPWGFLVSWYRDVPQGDPEPPFSRPGQLITNFTAHLLPYGVPTTNAYYVSETNACTVVKGSQAETEYYYYVRIDEPWNEKEGVLGVGDIVRMRSH